jgi:competence protein ComEA
MFKKIAALMMALFTFAAFAAVDVNKATAAELDSIKGIGQVLSGKILDERKKNGAFKDWNDMVTRVNGVGENNAAKFSAEGLTVNGASMPGAKTAAKPAAAAAAKTDMKADTKTDMKAEAAKPMKADKAMVKEEKAVATTTTAAKPAAKVEKVEGAVKDAANDAKAKTLEAVGAKK